MTLSRRKFLALVGGGTILAAGSAAGTFLATRTPGSAIAPWSAAGGYTEPRMRALSYAVLAPSPHNRQPWVADLQGDDRIVLWRDKDRNLPETDPFDRQLVIGMGCFIELLRMAAADQGIVAETELYPEGDDGPVAVVTFGSGGQADPLFDHVVSRHTNRQPYKETPVPAAAVAELSRYARIETDPDRVEALRNLTWDAMEIEMRTTRTHMESVDLFRLGKREIEANPDGIYLGGPLFETLMLAGLMTREGQADPTSGEFQQSLEFLRKAALATPAYGVITTTGNSREDQIAAGRDWLRLHLAASGLGLAMQPMSQALQEYPEQAELYDRVHSMLAAPGETVQMLGRLGYGPSAGPSPRWPLETRLLNA